jgi:hypothetical protein
MNWFPLAICAVTLSVVPVPCGFGSASAEEAVSAPYRSRTLRGRVVWLSEALDRRFGAKTVPEARERILALETTTGDLHPLIEDVRGRSFRKDHRLREMDVELLVRQYRAVPLVQVIRVTEVSGDGRFLIDYWCDTCSIEMYEDGPCDCCQEHNRLRKRPLPLDSPPAKER